jgi:hypothetical protein
VCCAGSKACEIQSPLRASGDVKRYRERAYPHVASASCERLDRRSHSARCNFHTSDFHLVFTCGVV